MAAYVLGGTNLLQKGANIRFHLYLNPDKVARPGRAAGTTTPARGSAQDGFDGGVGADLLRYGTPARPRAPMHLKDISSAERLVSCRELGREINKYNGKPRPGGFLASSIARIQATSPVLGKEPSTTAVQVLYLSVP